MRVPGWIEESAATSLAGGRRTVSERAQGVKGRDDHGVGRGKQLGAVLDGDAEPRFRLDRAAVEGADGHVVERLLARAAGGTEDPRRDTQLERDDAGQSEDGHAAALPLAALTAWQSLVETGGLQPGQRVLIHAAAGGVGHLAVQIAKARGAHVIGTASASKHDLVRALGADEVIDYTTVDFAAEVRDVDIVLDTIGGDYGPRSLRVLRRGGALVSLADHGPVEQAAPLGIRAGFTLVEPDYAGLQAIVALVEAGRLRVEIDTVFPLEQAAKAHELSETGRATGKIVLTV
jgi:threonine dehydrogenase-like Zn-dependent dehydrogenase